MSPCVFCAITAGQAAAEIVQVWADAIAVVPLDPCTDGHLIVIPRAHVEDAAEDPIITGAAAARAAEIAEHAAPCNIITSVGAHASQTIRHLHWHVVPRRPGDGLALPWPQVGAS